MFNRTAFKREVLSLPMYIRASVTAGVKNMSIASQLDSVVEAIYVMKEIKGYPYKEVADLLKKHGLKAATSANIAQWYTSRQKSVDLLSQCAIDWRNGKLNVDGNTVPPLPEEIAAFSDNMKDRLANEDKEKARGITIKSEAPKFTTEVPSFTSSYNKDEPVSKSEPFKSEQTHKDQKQDDEGTVEVDENLVLDWGVFLKSCRAKYNVTSSEVSAELINRGLVNEEKELTRVNEYFPGAEPFETLNWAKVKVKATLALLLFG